MAIKTEDLVPELQRKLAAFLLACGGDPDLQRLGCTVVLTEGRRTNIRQAHYFCQGRTPSEIAAELDHKQASQEIRAVMAEAIQIVFGSNAMPEDRAPGRIITHALPYTGPHCEGRAAHFRVKQGPRVLSDAETPWEIVGAIAKRCGLVWGGDWKWDYEHLEVPRPKPSTSTIGGRSGISIAASLLLFCLAIGHSPSALASEIVAWTVEENSLVAVQLDTDGDGLADREELHVVARSGRTVMTDAELDRQAEQDHLWLFIVEEDDGRFVYFVQPAPLEICAGGCAEEVL